MEDAELSDLLLEELEDTDALTLDELLLLLEDAELAEEDDEPEDAELVELLLELVELLELTEDALLELLEPELCVEELVELDEDDELTLELEEETSGSMSISMCRKKSHWAVPVLVK